MIHIPYNKKWIVRESGIITPMTKIEEGADYYIQNYDVIARYIRGYMMK